MIFQLRLEINCISAAVLIVLILNNRRNLIRMLDEKLFQLLLCSSLASIVLDSLTWWIDGKTFAGASLLLNIFNILYFFTCVFTPYVWLLYAQFRLTENERKLRKNNKFYVIPLLLFLFLLFSSPWTNWIFYGDAKNVYHRGPLYFTQIIVTLFYLLHASLIAFRQGKRLQVPSERRECFQVAGFIIWPILGTSIQVLFYGLPVVSPTMAFGELIIFINLQNQQISLDALTKINNRGQLNRYLNVRTTSDLRNTKLYMLLIDID